MWRIGVCLEEVKYREKKSEAIILNHADRHYGSITNFPQRIEKILDAWMSSLDSRIFTLSLLYDNRNCKR